MKNRVLISLFPMVGDIDQLERILILLKQNSRYINRDKFHIILDVTYPLSDYFVDWGNSLIPRQFFEDKFNALKKYGDWFDECYFNIDLNLKGCVDYVIGNLKKYEVDDIIWLDPDAIFNEYTLLTFLEASLEIKKEKSKYIITPEYVKLWDSTWDIIVNEGFKAQDYGYEKVGDPIEDSWLSVQDISLEPMNVFKFAGGWFTLLSKELLDHIFKGLEDVKGYTPIDTFVMIASSRIPNTIQYKIKNMVVCEDKKYNFQPYKNYIKTIDRKNDYYEESWIKMMNSLPK